MYDFFSFLQSFCKGQPIYIAQYIAYNQTFFLFVNFDQQFKHIQQ